MVVVETTKNANDLAHNRHNYCSRVLNSFTVCIVLVDLYLYTYYVLLLFLNTFCMS